MEATKNEFPSEMNAFGKKVPDHRVENAYRFSKDVIGFDSLTSLSIVNNAARNIEIDETIHIIGEASFLSEDMQKLDLTGRYRLLAILVTG